MLVPFSPPPGLNSDDTIFSAEGQWVDGNGFRFQRGRPETIGYRGYFFQVSDSREAYGLTCFANGGSTYVAWGYSTQLGIGAVADGVPTLPVDRLAAPCPATQHWSFATFGSTLLAVPKGGTIYAWTGSGNAALVTAAPRNPARQDQRPASFGIQAPEAYLTFLNAGFRDLLMWSVEGASGDVVVPGGCFLESGGMYMDNSKQRLMIREVVPDFEFQNASVDLTIMGRDAPNSVPLTKADLQSRQPPGAHRPSGRR